MHHLLLLILLALASPISAQDHGRFLGTLSLSEDRIAQCFEEDTEGYYSLFRLSAEFGFENVDGQTWVVPSDTCVNGASIPTAFWSVIGGPWSGPYRRASVVHDHFVRTKERSWQDTHRVFFDAMRASDVPTGKAKLMYFAVRRFGARWEGRTKSIPECTRGSISRCLKWKERQVTETLVVVPEPPDPSIDINTLLLDYRVEELSLDEIDALADSEVSAELLRQF